MSSGDSAEGTPSTATESAVLQAVQAGAPVLSTSLSISETDAETDTDASAAQVSPVAGVAEGEREPREVPVSLSVAAQRWAKLRDNFRLAALRSIAEDKREALKKLQEVRKRADKAQEAQSDSRTCKICWDRATNTVCLDCGHQCMCTRCGACMTFCPICMQDISDLVELQ